MIAVFIFRENWITCLSSEGYGNLKGGIDARKCLSGQRMASKAIITSKGPSLLFSHAVTSESEKGTVLPFLK